MEPLLERFGVDSPLLLAAVSAAIVVIGILVALLFHKAIFPLAVKLAHRTPTNLDARLITAGRLPFSIGIVLLGAYLAVTLPLQLAPTQLGLVNLAARLLAVAWGVWLAAKVFSQAFSWYGETIAPNTASNLDDRLLPLARRMVIALIYAVGGLLILDQLSINISPLIAGLGLGGVAVALALQPTLSNLFAGTYVMTEGVVTAGDYIELEDGVAGYVIDVGWRSTRLRTWRNNLVVIPNARFAETIITNYQEPIPAVNVFVNCGVSYDSDLRRVREVCHEVMDDLLERDSNAVKEYGGWFGYESFGDSNVNFWLFLQARNRLASFELQTVLMQDLHRKLGEEGIVINYPVRTLQFPPGVTGAELMGKEQRGATAGRNGRRGRRRTRRQRDAPGVAAPESGPAGAGPGPSGPDIG